MLQFDIQNSKNLQLDLPQLPVSDFMYDGNTEFTYDDSEGDGETRLTTTLMIVILLRTVVNIILVIKAVLVLVTWMMSNNWYRPI